MPSGIYIRTEENKVIRTKKQYKKTCIGCEKNFEHKDKRQKYCNRDCYYKKRFPNKEVFVKKEKSMFHEVVFCQCGCGKKVLVSIHHKWRGIPKFIHGHNNKGKSGELYNKNSGFKKGYIPSKEHIRNLLKSLYSRPTQFEKKISELCIENSLPFIYTGNGTFFIGNKNPDFVNKEKRIVIEVYYSYHKKQVFGSCEEYEKQRSEYFAKYGWKTIFIKEDSIESKNWKEVCLNKIRLWENEIRVMELNDFERRLGKYGSIRKKEI